MIARDTSGCWQARLCNALAFGLLVFLVGCKGSGRLASIEQLDQPPDIRIDQHTVFRGDTLYSIAWRYGMDYRQIAQINNIRPPYTIYIGQRLDLGRNQAGVGNRDVTSGSTQVIAVPDSGYGRGDNSGVREIGGVHEISSSPAMPASGDAVKGDAVSPQPAGANSGGAHVEPSVQVSSARVTPASKSQWLWPAQGQLIGRFSNTNALQKGVDIGGSPGSPVIASAGGSVVYAGSGLAGYGELLIIKHDEQFLSAYAHNSKLLVAEGEQVRAGQPIAEMGSSGTDRTKLHFEIRQAGKPVDPLLFLPRR